MAETNPDKMREMTDLMFAEFAKYQVVPLDASVATRLVTPRPSQSAQISWTQGLTSPFLIHPAAMYAKYLSRLGCLGKLAAFLYY